MNNGRGRFKNGRKNQQYSERRDHLLSILCAAGTLPDTDPNADCRCDLQGCIRTDPYRGWYLSYLYLHTGKGFCHDHGSFKWRGCFCTRCIPFYDTIDRDQTASMDAGSFCTCGQSMEIQGSISSEKRRTEILECAADRKPDLYCTWNRDPVRKISEDHDFTDLFRMGAGL